MNWLTRGFWMGGGVAALALAAPAQNLPGRTLLWADEFAQSNGSPPDAAKWGYDIGGSGWGNNELQYYTNRTENARIEDGRLVIEARAEPFGGRNYTSARLLTKGKNSWTYGRIEARIQIPRGQGIWPAFWMLGANIDSAGWPGCGEIDILENIGSLPSNLYGTVHGPGYSGGSAVGGNTVLPGAALADDFHVYAIEWEENRIRWFIDGQQYFSVTPGSLPNGSAWVFNQPQFLILNVAVGGNWPGNPDGSTVFPQRMSVDYVRVYTPVSVVPETAVVTVDPAESWLGYMHVSDLPANGGAYRFGGTWTPADLRSRFSGTSLILEPNAIADPAPYWYVGGGAPGRPGNKIMQANLYVEKSGSLAGKSVTFRGTVAANTLTAAHRASAFIRDFSPDYSSSTTVTAPLVNGAFSINMTTDAGAGRHVQYGFETTGVNVWATDLAPLGSVRIGPASPMTAWISGLDFVAFANPDLTAAGDPDGDGQSNFKEFALNSDPRSAAVSSKLRTRIEDLAGGKSLVLTLPVRGNPEFIGTPGKSATADQVSYLIEGSNGLSAFDQGVTEIPASAAGLPVLDNGWSYRSFRLNGWVGGGSPRGPEGFLRVRLT
ncbi:glycoside hydrolase family 16 protein, partial [bacterium]|nr:glycoside hydrolase family 16 protein [bacterium]